MNIIFLNVTELNAPIKEHKVENWIRKLNLTFFCPYETQLNKHSKYRLKVKGWKTIIQAKNSPKNAGVTI